MTNAYFLGDIHGHLDKMVRLLQNARLINEKRHWIGDEATLCYMGDFADRGPDGVEVIDFVMRLQQEAADAGGQVLAVMGNHEITLLAAYWFPQARLLADGATFREHWLRNGGIESDLDRLTPSQAEWLLRLPAMVQLGSRLVVHADAWLYTRYGRTIDEVSFVFHQLFEEEDTEGLDRLMEEFAERFAFTHIEKATEFMLRYGDTHARQIIHGHTPITKITGQPPETISSPYIYGDGLCVNMDGGMYLGSPGFIYQPD